MKKLTAQQAIKELRADGYTQKQIGDAARVDQKTISRIERGVSANVLLSTSERILEAHRLTLGETTDKGEQNENQRTNQRATMANRCCSKKRKRDDR